MAEMTAEAQRLVAANRNVIAAVAEALLASDDLSLTGRQVKEIVDGR